MVEVRNKSNEEMPGMGDSSAVLVVDRVEQELRKLTRVPNSKLPHERDLAAQLKVSRHSVREAMERLKRENLVRSIPGKGTFTLVKTPVRPVVHLISTSTQVYTMVFIGVISELLREKGFSSHVICSPDVIDAWAKVDTDVEASLGGILVGPMPREAIVRLANASPLPLVQVSETLEAHRSAPVCDAVVNDNRALAYRAASYLIQQGHRRVGIVGWGPAWVWDRDMAQGYMEALAAAGIEPRSQWIFRLPEQEALPANPERYAQESAAGHEQARGLIAAGELPTAFISAGDDELRTKEGLREYFGDRFDERAIVPTISWEILQTNYRGRTPLTASCGRLRDLAERAIELLQRRRKTPGPPTREFHGRIYLAKRQNGLWKLEE